MFTGIIRLLLSYSLHGSELVLQQVPSKHLEQLRIGDSIAVNGVCLTVRSFQLDEEYKCGTIFFFVMKETLERTNLVENEKVQRCNVEFALKKEDRLDGHLVMGHVDTTAEVMSIELLKDGSRTIRLKYDSDYQPTLKDSIALDGISLTISDLVSEKSKELQVSIIPATFEATVISNWKIGTTVNVEFNNKQIPSFKNISPSFAVSERSYMLQALKLSEKATQTAPPNPWVGAVIVKDDKVLGTGYHQKPGTHHAETAAIEDAKRKGHDVTGATIYVTLEPCFPPKSKTKRRDPCCMKLIESKFKRVVIGVLDPDQRTTGKSMSALLEAGIEVDVGLCKEEISFSLRGYIFSRSNNRPYGIAKIALSLDGCYASSDKSQVWITPKDARIHGRSMMRHSQAVVEGTLTALNDFEALSKRVSEGFAPQSIYLDRQGRLPPYSAETENKSNQKSPIRIYTGLSPEEYSKRYVETTLSSGERPEIRSLPIDGHNQLDLMALTHDLHSSGVLSVVYEGGALLHRSLIEAGLIDEIWIYRGNRTLPKGINWFETVNLNGFSLEPIPLPEKESVNSIEWSLATFLLKPNPVVTEVHTALSDLRAGRPIILMDSADREDEADLILAAEDATPEKLELFRRHGTGIVCTPMLPQRALKLGLPVLTSKNEDALQTNFALSCDAVKTTTGVSASDRAVTLKTLANPSSTRLDFTRPGHLFPLLAEYGDLQLRQGHTEGSVTLCSLAHKQPVATIVELVQDGGEMMRYRDCQKLIKKLSDHPDAPRTILRMEILKEYLELRPMHHLRVISSSQIELSEYGVWQLLCYEANDVFAPHVVLLKGDPFTRDYADNNLGKGILTRIHSECFTGDVLGSSHCDCGPQLHMALKKITDLGAGLLIFPSRHEGRSIGLVSKIHAYHLQAKEGLDTYEANRKLGLKEDGRDYTAIKAILSDLGLPPKSLHLLTENPRKCAALSEFVRTSSPLRCGQSPKNQAYLSAKRDYHRSLQPASMQIVQHRQAISSKIDDFNTTPITVTSTMRSKQIGIITTYWHRSEVDTLVNSLNNTLVERGLNKDQISILRVPGCGDMTTTISDRKLQAYDLLICVGFILKGETDHAKYTSEKVTAGILKLSKRIDRPIIDGILHCRNEEQIESKLRSGTAESFAISALLVLTEHC